MKKFIFSMVIVIAAGLAASDAEAKRGKKWKRPYGMAGCGLGTKVVGAHGSQILASTTNGTSANQLFGITSGTSNCIDGKSEEVAQKMDRFVETNKVAFASDIARGNGETLVTVASILGCERQEMLGSAMQENFSSIYPNERVHTVQITDSVLNLVTENPALYADCKAVSTI